MAIYIYKATSITDDVVHWLTYDNKDQTYFMHHINYAHQIVKESIPLEEIQKNYIPFSIFLEKAKFIGREDGIYVENKLLYLYKDIALRIKEGRFTMDYSITNKISIGNSGISLEEKALYQDKKYVYHAFVEQINTDIENIQQENRKK